MSPTNILVAILITLAALLFFWALYDLFYKRKEENLSGMKFLWAFVLFLFPILGPIFYFQTSRRR